MKPCPICRRPRTVFVRTDMRRCLSCHLAIQGHYAALQELSARNGLEVACPTS